MRRLVAVAFLAIAATCAGAETGAERLRAHRELERRVRREEAKNARILDEVQTLERGAAMFRTAGELMTGARTELPPAEEKRVTIAVYEPDAAATFALAPGATKSSLRMQGLDLEAGTRYRFSADVTAAGACPARRIKFGLRVVLRDGKVDWPGARIANGDEAASFESSRATFDYLMPHGAKAVLVYGLSAPATGSVTFANVKVERGVGP